MGETAYEQLRKQQYRGEVMKFGQAVEGRHAEALGQPKLQQRWSAGVWLGKAIDTDAHIVGTPNGVFTTRTCKALMRSDDELMRGMQWTPWRLNDPQPHQEKAKPTEPQPDEEEEEKQEQKEMMPEETRPIRERASGTVLREDAGEAGGAGSHTQKAKRLRDFYEA